MQRTLTKLLSTAGIVGIAATSAFFSAACDDGTYVGVPQPEPEDAGEPEPDIPEPPVFPLKEGDYLTFPAIGGRIEPCPQGEGFCDRAVRASYEINGVELNEETNRWEVDANYFYELTSAAIETSAIAQLFAKNVAPFDSLTEGGADDGTAVFVGDAAPTDQMTENDFPFFHFEQEYATREDSSYAAAQAEFMERVRQIDAEAEFSNQPAERQLQTYFVDNLGPSPFMHKVQVRYHPFGFVCNWEERLINYTDGMARNESSFAGATIPMAAIWSDPIRLTRDNVEYRCSCFTGTCRDGQGNCLSPADPDAAPSSELCN